MNLYQEIYHGESFGEEDFYDAARYVFNQELSESSAEEIDKFLVECVEDMTAEEAESFWKKLGNVAKKIGSGALKVASVAAPIVGTAFGPLGTMAGGLAGNLAGAGAKALDRVPDFKINRRRRRRGGLRRRRNPELRQAWNQTKHAARGIGKAALRGATRYAANNPVKAMHRATGPILGNNSSKILSSVLNNPRFQSLLFSKSSGENFADNYYEDLNESDYNYIEMIEAINYLSEDIIAEYYENDLLDDNQYFIDDHGELVVNYPEERVERMESFIEEVAY